MNSVTLYELNEYIHRVIALNFENPLWVQCEIAQARESRGQIYIELVQKSEDGEVIVAQAKAVLWNKRYMMLRRRLGDLLWDVLQDGMEVRLKVRVDFHERYGLKFVIDDVDPSYTLGNLEIKRREALETLRKKNLLDKNKAHALPLVPQRIAVLSASKAAGYQDFIQQLYNNPYGYYFDVNLYAIAVQGQQVEAEFLAAMHQIRHVHEHYDCLCIIRGGGSRLDLSAFDSALIGEAIAQCQLPVITGIGHDMDQSIADMVAHTALKTPTAVADFLIDLTAQFDGAIGSLYDGIVNETNDRVRDARQELWETQNALATIPAQRINQQRTLLSATWPQFVQIGRARLRHMHQELKHSGVLIEALDPVRVLQRGFSMTTVDGKVIRSVKTLAAGQKLATTFADGKTLSTITEISHE